MNNKTITEVLTDLIGIYSVTGSEKEIGDYIFDFLKKLDIDFVTRQQVSENRFNVVAGIKGRKPGPKILLTGHMDTVPAGDGWETNPFEAVIKGDRMYGRGSMDMKGGIAAAMSTFKYAAENRGDMPGELLLAFVPDEEAYSAGVNKLIENGVTADFGIAAEPEYATPVIGAVGKMLVKVDVKGVAAHGCQPELGVNAVEDSAKFLAALGQIPLLSHPYISTQPYVTLKIEGGFKEYSIVVPENCTILVNKHTVPAETKEYVLDEMQKLVQKLALKSKFTFSVEEPYYPAYDIGNNSPYLDKIKTIYKDVTGSPLAYAYGTGVSDNNRLVPLTGIPVLSIGPNGSGLHSCNEWVSIKSVHEMDQIYRRFVFSNI